jgi:hypothetical protein
VADEPPPRGAPLQVALRRRRRRPVLIGATAVVLILAAVVGLVAIRERRRPLPITDPTAGWILYSDAASNLQLRHPPDWVLRERAPGWIRLAPPEQAAGVAEEYPPFAVGVFDPAAGYLGGETGMEVTRGRFPSGRADTATEETIDFRDLPPDSKVHRTRTYTIDWDRKCAAGGTARRCRTQVVRAGLVASGEGFPQWDRFRAVAETIVGTIAPVTPGPPSSGDRSRPACRPGQWRLFHPGGWSYGDRAQRYVLEGGVESLGGPPCHLRLDLRLDMRLEVEKPAGRRLPLAGNPSTTVVEGDLPDDAQVASPNSSSFRPTPLAWHWAWQEWCTRACPRRPCASPPRPAPRSPCPDRHWPTRRRSPRPAARTAGGRRPSRPGREPPGGYGTSVVASGSRS